MARATLCLTVILPLVARLSAAELPARPMTPQRTVTDEYHGTKVADPYRWLENSADAEVQKWTDAQSRYTRAFLVQLPGPNWPIRKPLTGNGLRNAS